MLKTDDREKPRADADEPLVRDTPTAPIRQSATDIRDELQAHEAELELRDEAGLEEVMANSDAIFEAAPVAMLILDESTNVVRANAATLAMFGAARSDFEQRRPGNAMGCVHSSKDPRGCGYSKECPLCDLRNSIEALIAGGGALHRAEAMLVLVRDGTPRKVWLEFGAEQVVLNGRRHLCVALSDITERRKTEADLRASEEKQRSLFDHLDAGIVVHAPDTSIVQSNVRASVLLGLTPDQMRGKVAIDPGWRFVRDDGSPMSLPEYPVNQVVASGSPVVGQIIGVDRPASGGRAWVLVNAYPEYDEARALRQVVVTFADITSRKEAEQVLRVQQARLDAAALSGKLGLWDLDLVTGAAWRTPQHDRLFGYGELQSSWGAEDALRHVVPDDRPIFERAFEEAFATGHFHYQLRINPVGHPMRWIEANGEVIRDESGKPVRMTGTVADITDRKQAEEGVAASEAKYRGLFDSLMDGFVLVGMDGGIRESNEEYRKMLGYSAEELAQLTYQDLTPERWRPVEALIVAEQVLRDGYSTVYEKEYRRKDGTVFPVELRTFLLREGGRHVAMWAIVRDITGIRSLQAQLALTSRLVALGTLVAGVAHEVNNPLAAALSDQDLALGAVRALRDRLSGSGPLDREAEVHKLGEVVEELGEAQEAGRRIERIIKNLKVFGRPSQKDARERVRLISVVDLAMRWLPAAVSHAATVAVENGGAPDVVATAGQITQVVVNLVTNAAKATPEGARGSIVIRVGPGSPGMARLEVIDHGSGIEPAVLPRIFDPFFTTSNVGKGTGLGLSICHTIVAAHGGTLTVESEVGKGSTFRVELPTVPAET